MKINHVSSVLIVSHLTRDIIMGIVKAQWTQQIYDSASP